jgi:hypothetical protein
VDGDTTDRPSNHVYRDVYVDGFHTAFQSSYLWSSVFDNFRCDFGLIGLDIYGLSVNNQVMQSTIVVKHGVQESRGIVFNGAESPSDSADVASEGWTVTNSVIFGGGTNIYIRGTTHVTVTSCIIDFSMYDGVRIQDNGTHFAGNCVIADNYIAVGDPSLTSGDWAAGVRVYNGVSDSQNSGNRITGNHVVVYSGDVCPKGIWAQGSESQSVIANNVLNGFSVSDVTLDCSGNVVTGNRCKTTPSASKNINPAASTANLIADNFGEVYLRGGDPVVYRTDALGYKEWTGLQAFAAGAHAYGERIINAYPAVGQPQGWICTVAGTPGTWTALPNL